MGCTAAHPPWLCKVFGKLPAGEREKLIMNNRLCPFCLLHDKDRPCGAKQRPVSVACAASAAKEGTSKNCTTSSRTCFERKIEST
jgi:hypothetical protein